MESLFALAVILAAGTAVASTMLGWRSPFSPMTRRGSSPVKRCISTAATTSSIEEGLRHPERESRVAVRTEVLRFLVLMVAKIAIRLRAVVPRLVRVRRLYVGGLLRKRLIAMAAHALQHPDRLRRGGFVARSTLHALGRMDIRQKCRIRSGRTRVLGNGCQTDADNRTQKHKQEERSFSHCRFHTDRVEEPLVSATERYSA